jgi:hypothetical protein
LKKVAKKIREGASLMLLQDVFGKNVEAYKAMRKNPGPAPYLEQAMLIAKFEPGMHEVVEVFHAV